MSDDNVIKITAPVVHAQSGLVREHEGHSILLDSYWNFKVTGPLYEERYSNSFSSLRLAVDDINNRIANQQKLDKARITLALSMLTEKGVQFIGRGIHTGTSALLGLPKDLAADHSTVYPNVPMVRDILALRAVHQATVDKCNALLHKAALRASRGYGRIDAEAYERKTTELQKEYDRAHAVALTFTLPTHQA